MSEAKKAILIADDEDRIRNILKINLQSEYQVFLARNGEEAKRLLESEPIDLVLTDLKMPGGISGLDLLEFVKKELPHVPLIMITAYGTVENAVQAMKIGAYDYILKPIKISELKALIAKALQYGELVRENTALKAQLKQIQSTAQIITVNAEMKAILEKVKAVAQTTATVLIQGESGTGKQLVARAIHDLSPRASGPWVEINCGAIPRELMESELFGHEKGAFTGAVSTKKGKFELAHGGTLFLDEIGELPLELQVKLLHVLEKQRFTRVGGTRFLETDARIIAATNRDLLTMVEEGKFRQDLFYRLRVVHFQIPPLRQRTEDIPVLVQHFLQKHEKLNVYGKKDISITPEALQALIQYPWPGNVRELENVIQQSIIFVQDGKIKREDLPPEILTHGVTRALTKEALQEEKKQKTEKILREVEYQFLIRLLQSTTGNISRAAEISGYNRRQIHNLINKYHLDVKHFKK